MTLLNQTVTMFLGHNVVFYCYYNFVHVRGLCQTSVIYNLYHGYEAVFLQINPSQNKISLYSKW